MISQPLTGYLPDRDPAIVARVISDAGLELPDGITLTNNEVQAPDDTDHAVLDAVAEKFAVITPTIPDQVTALQGLLALNQAGLSGAYETWANAPERTFAERAFRDKAQTWSRDNTVLQAAATALGITEAQMDDLFVLAATL